MDITIEKIIYTGKSLARVNGKVILTDEGLPGEIVRIKPIKDKKTYIEAKTLEIIKKSAERTTPQCSHYKTCSPYQYIDYACQLKIKEAQLKETLARELKTDFGDITVKPSPSIWGYRNKIRLKVLWKDKRPALAYHFPRTTDEFVRINECFLVSSEMNHFFADTLRFLAENKSHSVNEIEIKESFSKKDFLLILHSAPSKKPLVIGKDFIEEKVAGRTFQFGAQSFFQINVGALEHLIKDIKDSVALTGRETIADFYCGVGTFGITLAENAGRVIGVESEKANISFLKTNISINNIENFEIHEGYCERLISGIVKEKINLIIIDPPRKGVDDITLRRVMESGARSIVYVSCNPSTLARDIKTLLEKYRLKSVTLYDFFPHTTHIESCVVLELKGSSLYI